jgi:hypothetical protein
LIRAILPSGNYFVGSIAFAFDIGVCDIDLRSIDRKTKLKLGSTIQGTDDSASENRSLALVSKIFDLALTDQVSDSRQFLEFQFAIKD